MHVTSHKKTFTQERLGDWIQDDAFKSSREWLFYYLSVAITARNLFYVCDEFHAFA
jgi:hypothetical protein